MCVAARFNPRGPPVCNLGLERRGKSKCELPGVCSSQNPRTKQDTMKWGRLKGVFSLQSVGWWGRGPE